MRLKSRRRSRCHLPLRRVGPTPRRRTVNEDDACNPALVAIRARPDQAPTEPGARHSARRPVECPPPRPDWGPTWCIPRPAVPRGPHGAGEVPPPPGPLDDGRPAREPGAVHDAHPYFLLLIGLLLLASVAARALAPRIGLPAVVLYLGLGVGLRAFDGRFAFVRPEAQWTLAFLGELGIAVLLFQVGLRSHLQTLIAQLPGAASVWAANIVLSAGLSLATCIALGLGLVPSLLIATALSATSVGLSVSLWDAAGRLRTKAGHCSSTSRSSMTSPPCS